MRSRTVIYIALGAYAYAIKMLGGSFDGLFNALGLGYWRASIFALVLVTLFSATFLRYRFSAAPAFPPHPSKKATYLFWGFFLGLAAAGVFIRWKLISTVPILRERADMLPVIVEQIEAWRRGEKLYAVGSVYLPLHWFSYFPAFLLGVDLRWTNILGHVGLWWSLAYLFWRRRSIAGWSFPVSASLFLVVIGLHVFSKQGLREVRDCHTALLTLLLSAMMVVLERPSRRFAFPVFSILASAFALSRYPGVLFVFPAFLVLWRFYRRQAWFGLAIFAGMAALNFVLFPELVEGIRRGMQFYGKETNLLALEELPKYIGLTAILHVLGVFWLQRPLQALGSIVAATVALRRPDPRLQEGLALGALAYLSLLVFVSAPFHYVYAELVALLLFVIVTEEARAT